MIRNSLAKKSCVVLALVAGGCGDVSGIIADAAKTSAKEAIGEAVDGVIDDVVGGLVDLDGLSIPLNFDREED